MPAGRAGRVGHVIQRRVIFTVHSASCMYHVLAGACDWNSRPFLLFYGVLPLSLLPPLHHRPPPTRCSSPHRSTLSRWAPTLPPPAIPLNGPLSAPRPAVPSRRDGQALPPLRAAKPDRDPTHRRARWRSCRDPGPTAAAVPGPLITGLRPPFVPAPLVTPATFPILRRGEGLDGSGTLKSLLALQKTGGFRARGATLGILFHLLCHLPWQPVFKPPGTQHRRPTGPPRSQSADASKGIGIVHGWRRTTRGGSRHGPLSAETSCKGGPSLRAEGVDFDWRPRPAGRGRGGA